MEDTEQTDAVFLRDLAERLRHIPVMYGTGDEDIDRLYEIAASLPAVLTTTLHRCSNVCGDDGCGKDGQNV